ncbi:hypothetical protein THAOC_06392 [Thalassiosira oceanica]|uniref:Malate synthase n=1 Tax=Thalassiosira oceanica TaxID=159749 RepID=K0T4P9_THAOC|nr:hypothetical protein THAOC_06392 [Thalassiosira oceanica]|eukprot:EJK72109.1 hypothetical protein THAOC_06392 [Thalassiosira oceanica]
MEARSSSVLVEVHAPICAAASEILTPDSLRFVGYLCNRFEDRRRALLAARQSRAMEFDSGALPHFEGVRQAGGGTLREPHSRATDDPHWQCAPIPSPVDRKMVINGLNSGANVYMADFEDSTSPTWSNLTEGQRNLRDAVCRKITYTNPKTGKVYALKDKTAVLFVRPRGWHLDEAHVTVNGRVASGSLFDFGLFFFHNVHTLLQMGTRPYFYLPKLEDYLEARLWNDVFKAAQSYFGVSYGTIRATVLLETITAAFQMEEILYELKDHSLGLNCGRWDYLFSYIKKMKCHEDKIAPDRSFLTMTDTPLLKAYVDRLIFICHKRGTFAMGGMAAQIPIKNDPSANDAAMARIKKDKIREALAGHDGTWVAHPALVSLAKNVFDNYMPTPNQIDKNPGLAGKDITEADLLKLREVPTSKAITSVGLKRGISIVLAYTEAWLRGVGCIPLNHHMEDAATAEISRAQIWQWRHHGLSTQDDGVRITKERISKLVNADVKVRTGGEDVGKWFLAGKLVEDMLNKENLDDFLTSVCYPHILTTKYEGDVIPEDEFVSKL